jgi:hypothetical protein
MTAAFLARKVSLGNFFMALFYLRQIDCYIRDFSKTKRIIRIFRMVNTVVVTWMAGGDDWMQKPGSQMTDCRVNAVPAAWLSLPALSFARSPSVSSLVCP